MKRSKPKGGVSRRVDVWKLNSAGNLVGIDSSIRREKMTNNAPVLVAEDDPNDVFLLRRAFKKAGVSNPLVVFHNGQEAIDYLSGETTQPGRETRSCPALFFLDLKMPLMDGFDVLMWLQAR